MFTAKTFLICLALVASMAVGYRRVARSVRNARTRKQDHAYETEVAAHWSDIAAAPEVGKRPSVHVFASRNYSLADLRSGGVGDAEIRCNHGLDATPRVIMLFAERVALDDDIPACVDCISAMLTKYGTVCTACKQLVLPGDDVAISTATRDISFEHIRVGCCDDISRYCGIWGKHSLVSLHHMFPGSFPENRQAFHALDKSLFGRRRAPNNQSS